ERISMMRLASISIFPMLGVYMVSMILSCLVSTLVNTTHAFTLTSVEARTDVAEAGTAGATVLPNAEHALHTAPVAFIRDTIDKDEAVDAAVSDSNSDSGSVDPNEVEPGLNPYTVVSSDRSNRRYCLQTGHPCWYNSQCCEKRCYWIPIRGQACI
ncbi:hypothetical protein BG011_000215, partial [Mortierella polycephala]